MSDEEKPLQRITELTICGEKYELAANGQGYLIQRKEKDAYSQPIARAIDLPVVFKNSTNEEICKFAQDLIDHLVTAHRQLQTSRDSRLGVGKDTEK